MIEISEAKDVSAYKSLILILGDYSNKFPATGVDKMYQQAIDNGVKIMPTDKQALRILTMVLDSGSVPASVQKFLNTRFVSLPVDVRPYIKSGRKREVAFWGRDGSLYDKVRDLVNFGGGAKGYWCDADGSKTSLIDMSK